MKNKKGQSLSDATILLGIIVFQAFIIICLGFLNVEQVNYAGNLTSNIVISSFFSLPNIITSITVLGWGNLLIFAPLEVILIYIIAKLIRGGG